METLDGSDLDSIQIKAILLDQIKDHDGCLDEFVEDSTPPILEWPTGLGTVPDIPASHIVGVAPQYDFVGFAEDDTEVWCYFINKFDSSNIFSTVTSLISLILQIFSLPLRTTRTTRLS